MVFGLGGCGCLGAGARRHRHHQGPQGPQLLSIDGQGMSDDIVSFSFEALSVATSDFEASQILGEGGFGVVYNGRLADNRVVAVKRTLSSLKVYRESFLAELNLLKLDRLRHPNIIRMVGYHATVTEMMLVLEKISLGSLDERIYNVQVPDKEPLDWTTRLMVAKRIAVAVAFLHSENVVHRDIKPANILLDEGFVPKLIDFGIAMHLPNGVVTFSSTSGPPGTFGYVDPTCLGDRSISFKSDVYSFGVVLLVLLSGRKAYTENLTIAEWARPKFAMPFHTWVSPVVLATHADGAQIDAVIQIARTCLLQERDNRPTMATVVELLSQL